MSWDKIRFGDLYAVPSRNGLSRPQSTRGVGCKMINMGELFKHDRIGDIEMERVLMSDKDLERATIEEGDLLFARQSLVREGAGKCSIVKQVKETTTFESHLIRVRLNKDIANPFFYYYYFVSPYSNMQSIIQQCAQAGIRGSELSELSIHYPPFPIQLKIAAILSAYDDLIENNLKRIALLEEAARQLYKEWFVRLRFPGHEHTRIVDSVPEGWSEGVVGNLVKVQSGYAFKSRDWLTEGNPVIKIKNIDNNTLDINDCQCVSDEVAETAAKFQLKEGDFLIAMTGATIGKVGIMPRTQKRYYLNQRVGILRPTFEPNPTPFLFTFFNTENAQSQVLNFAAGAAQPNISPGQLESIKFLLPTESLLNTFIESRQPLFDQRLILLEQNEKLRQARDLLLPRLMSGEIPV